MSIVIIYQRVIVHEIRSSIADSCELVEYHLIWHTHSRSENFRVITEPRLRSAYVEYSKLLYSSLDLNKQVHFLLRIIQCVLIRKLPIVFS